MRLSTEAHETTGS